MSYSPKGGGSSGGPGPNALAVPQQQQTTQVGGNALAGNFGTGLMQGAMDIKQQYPIWQQQFSNGETEMQFPEWLKDSGQQNPAMPSQGQPQGQPQAKTSMGGYFPRGY